MTFLPKNNYGLQYLFPITKNHSMFVSTCVKLTLYLDQLTLMIC